MERANEGLVLAVVTDGAPRRTDTRAECGLRNDTAMPYRFDQLILAHDSIAVSNEIDQQIKYLWFDRNNHAGASQLLSRHIDFEIREVEVQSMPRLQSGHSRPPSRNASDDMGGHRGGDNILHPEVLQKILREIQDRL